MRLSAAVAGIAVTALATLAGGPAFADVYDYGYAPTYGGYSVGAGSACPSGQCRTNCYGPSCGSCATGTCPTGTCPNGSCGPRSSERRKSLYGSSSCEDGRCGTCPNGRCQSGRCESGHCEPGRCESGTCGDGCPNGQCRSGYKRLHRPATEDYGRSRYAPLEPEQEPPYPVSSERYSARRAARLTGPRYDRVNGNLESPFYN
jgi:hypothetical protein